MQVSRAQVLAHRLRASGLDRRSPFTADGLRRAAQAGLTDSVPRAAVLSIHARVADTPVDVLDDEALEQVWGPRYSAYVVAAGDRAPFTLGRLPVSGAGRTRAFEMAERVRSFLDGRTMTYAEAGRSMGVDPNALRYATTTGTLVIRWEGAGRPLVTSVDAPDVDEEDARRELVRRFLHVLGPATVDDFSAWAGVRAPAARATFAAIDDELVEVDTPIGRAAALADDEPSLRADPDPVEGVRLLPSGDVRFLAWGAQRELLMPDASRRDELWTSRVWPGAVVADGEIIGVWRRSGAELTVDPWVTASPALRDAVDAEAATLPLPLGTDLHTTWPP